MLPVPVVVSVPEDVPETELPSVPELLSVLELLSVPEPELVSVPDWFSS